MTTQQKAQKSRIQTLRAPLLLISELVNKGDIPKSDIKNAKFVILMFEKHFLSIEPSLKFNQKNLNNLRYLLLKYFNPQHVTRIWWKNYKYSANKCIDEFISPYSTV